MGSSSSKSGSCAGSKALTSKTIRKAIRNKRLAPISAGQDEDASGTLDECPICLLHYPSVNTTSCCDSSLCSECFVQVALSRSGQEVLLCPFCNKSPYAVVYKTKTHAQRTAERSERARVEAALLRARQEEERLAELRRLKRMSEGATSAMSPEEGSLAEEWARAREDEARFLEGRQERWRAALARAQAAADSGEDDMDVEELMRRIHSSQGYLLEALLDEGNAHTDGVLVPIMQAMLLSLDEQHSSGGGSGGSGSGAGAGPSTDGATAGGASAYRDAASGSSAGGMQDTALGRPSPCASLQGAPGAAATEPVDANAGAGAGSSGVAAVAAPLIGRGSRGGAARDKVPDSELLAHAATLAETARGFRLGPPAGSSQDAGALAGGHVSGGPPAAASAAARAPEARGLEIRAVFCAESPAADAATSDLRQPPSPANFTAFATGSAALAGTRAAADCRPAAPAQGAAPIARGSAATGVATAGGIGSAALTEALAVANGWPSAAARQAGRQQTAQAAAAQPPPFVGMVTVHLAGAPAVDRAAAQQPAVAEHKPESQSEAQPAAARIGAEHSSAAADDNESAALLGEAGGAAVMLQPDGSAVLVLLTSGASCEVAEAQAAKEGAAAGGGGAAAGISAGTSVPLIELYCQGDDDFVSVVNAADAAMLQHTNAAVQQVATAAQQADDAYRQALDAYAAHDAAMLRAMQEGDERLRAAWWSG